MKQSISNMSSITPENVESALLCISSRGTTAEQVKEAETALLTWESLDPDQYLDALQVTIIGSSSTNNDDDDVVCAAILSLKAAIPRHWNISRNNKTIIRPETKQRIRELFLHIVTTNNYNSMMQYQSRYVLAKLARLDYNLQMNYPLLLSTLFHHGIWPATQPHFWSLQQHRDCSSATGTGVLALAFNSLLALECVMDQFNISSLLLVDKNYIQLITMMNMETIASVMEHASTTIQSSINVTTIIMLLQYTTVFVKIIHKLLLIGSLPSTTTTQTTSTTMECPVTRIFTKYLLHILTVLVHFATQQQYNGHHQHQHQQQLIKAIMELIVELQFSHPIAFMPFAFQYLDFFYNTLITTASVSTDYSAKMSSSSSCDETSNNGLTTFRILVFRYLSNVLSYTSNNISSRPIDDGSMAMEEDRCCHYLNDFFTAGCFVQLIDFILTRIIPEVAYECLQVWIEDPESFYILFRGIKDEDDDNATTTLLQLSAQNLYLAIIEHSSGRSNIAPYMTKAVNDFTSQMAAAQLEADNTTTATTDNNDDYYCTILLWESLYTAIGLSANVLESFIDVNVWFTECIYPCLFHILKSNTSTNEVLHHRARTNKKLPILQFRFIWLIGCFGHLQNSSCLTLAYSALMSILINDDNGPQSNDIAVRLGAAQCMSNLLYLPIDGGEILIIAAASTSTSPNSIVSSSSSRVIIMLLTSLFRLLSECHETDSMSQVMSLISQIITEVGNNNNSNNNNLDVATLANTVMAHLPPIWHHCEHTILRGEVLEIFTKLARMIGCSSTAVPDLFSTAILIIDHVLANYEENLYLIDDVLLLWLTLLLIASSYDVLFQGLFTHVLDIIRLSYDNLGIIMKITEMYILLGGIVFLSVHSHTVSNLLVSVVGEVRPRGVAYVTLVTEALLGKFPNDGALLLKQAGICKTMLTSCASTVRQQVNHEPDGVIVQYLTSLSRCLVVSPQLLDDYFPLTFESSKPFYLHDLVEMIISRFESLTDVGQCQSLWKRLWAMALLSLLPPTPSVYSQQMLKTMNDIIRIFVNVLAEEHMMGHGATYNYYAVMDDEDNEELTQLPNKSNYKTMMIESVDSDIVVQANFKALVKAKLGGLAQVLGQVVNHEVMCSVDPITVQQLGELLNTTE